MIDQATLRQYRFGRGPQGTEKIVEAARRRGEQTAFLSHSHKDAELAEGLQGFLASQGWEVYIDWQDSSMPPIPNRETARNIKLRIAKYDWFFYLATQNSAESRWCPWEIGYADGVKDIDKIVIFPTRDANGRHHGNEYLQLYRHINPAQGGGFIVLSPGMTRGTLLQGMTP